MATVYKTIQGDTWDVVALKVYQEERYLHVLVEANPEQNGTVIFAADVVLNVPDILIPKSNNLPPWKR